MFIFCTGLHLWKRLWSFSSHWQKLFTVTNNSQNRLLDGQTGERGAQAWKSQVSGIVQPLRCEMMHFETITKPENHLDTVSSRPVAASHHCLEVLAKNLEIQFVFSYQEPESAKEKEMHILKSNWTCWARNPPTKASPAPFVSTISSLKRWIIINGFSFEFERMWRYFGMGATGKEWSFPCSTAITWNKKFPSVSVL